MRTRLTLSVITAMILACGVCRAEPPAAVVNFEFPGGTVAEYVKAVRKVAPKLNIVLHPEAEGMVLPRVVLHNIPAAGLLTGGLAGFDGRDQGLALEVRTVGPGPDVFHITARPLKVRRVFGQPPPRVKVLRPG